MALFGGRSEDGAVVAEVGGSPAPATRAPLSAFIDQGSEFEGKLSFKDTVRIDGCFRGEIASENTLVVGETGEIFASVRSRTVVIAGAVTGNVVAGERLVLQKTARLEGDVQAGALQIEDGALLNGRVVTTGKRAG